MYDAFCKRMSAHELKHRLMVMNHGAEVHSMYTVVFRYFRTKIMKHESTFTTLKHTPSAFQGRTKFITQFRNLASRQSREITNSGNFRGYQTYSRGTKSPKAMMMTDDWDLSWLSRDLLTRKTGAINVWMMAMNRKFHFVVRHLAIRIECTFGIL